MRSTIFDQSAVAKDIEAICSKCGESWHVIVAVAEGKIVRVQCKGCGANHRYRPVAADRMTLKKNTRTTIAASTRTVSTAPKSSKKAEIALPKPLVEANDRPIRPYQMKSRDYQLGDRLEHSKFGLGVVDGFVLPDKMYVSFPTARVLLIYGR